jgi:predicted ATPase
MARSATFRNLRLAGYKSIRQAEVGLDRVNVLIGANGSGKSNFLSFFKLLRQLATGGVQSAIGRAGGANALLHFGAKRTTQMSAFLEVVWPDSATNTYSVNLGYSAGDRLVVASEALARDKDASVEADESRADAGPESELAAESRRGVWLWQGFFHILGDCLVYHFHDTSDEARIHQNGDIEDNHFLREDGRNLAAFLYALQKTKPDSYHLIVRTIRLVAPFFRDFSLAPNALNPRTISLRWRDEAAREDFGSFQLSDGTLRFMALATLLLQPPDTAPGVILVDEPELGLHPYAVTVLASLIRRAAEHSQVIIGTQSPELLSQFEPDEVIVVDRKEGATEFRRLESEALGDWLQDYSLGELWEKNVLGGRPSR